MRVAVVSESFLPTVNGVTTSVVRVLDHLAATGHEATVIVPAAGSPREYAGFPVTQVPALAYRQFPVGLPNSQVSGLLAAFRPDVLHVAAPFLLGAQAIAAANRLGVPSVAIYQTDVSGYAKRNRLAAASAFAWRLVRWIHEGADLTLAPSTAALADLRAAGVPRVDRWVRGVDLERYHPSHRAGRLAMELRERLAPAGETVVGYVGRVAPETYLGALGGDDLANAYAALDLFVHTGTEETFGQTLQEAQASGLPVIAPRAGGPLDLVDHGVNGLLYDPASESELRAAVAALATAPELRARMGEAGRRRVLGRSWAAVCDDLLGFYAQVVTARALAVART
jgi:phosphatidylinositol alpha 1,6-mannosyltransferase